MASWRRPAAIRTEGFSSPKTQFLSPSVASSTVGTPDSLANGGGDWDNGREKNGHSLFPNNVLGLTPFFDELINNFGSNTRAQRACERLQTAARGSTTRQRSRDSAACVEEENIQSLADDSRFSMSSQYSQQDEDVDYSPSPRCSRLDNRSSNSDARTAKNARGLHIDGAVQEGNILDQASDLFESVRLMLALHAERSTVTRSPWIRWPASASAVTDRSHQSRRARPHLAGLGSDRTWQQHAGTEQGHTFQQRLCYQLTARWQCAT